MEQPRNGYHKENSKRTITSPMPENGVFIRNQAGFNPRANIVSLVEIKPCTSSKQTDSSFDRVEISDE
ncbi:hypothetical protein [Longimicrobium terrae]|uniref:hypothetical protein n=1 Tax=Longimicrobium terrae TaxID=1639882 RepID=UPI00179B43C8|nr:hypothetical protein [Longimicrobium terrae]MBB4637800.1 hypothetical protein [Longimicrobium terrae]